MYDVRRFLQDEKIPYKTSGTNVSAGWIEIHCPFPFCNDPSEHMGVNLATSMYNCWKCGEHGPFTKLVSVILKCGWKRAEEISAEYFKPSLIRDRKEEITERKKFAFPTGTTDKLPALHKSYLKSRGFDSIEVQTKYGVKACYQIGELAYRYRLIIPIIMFGRIMSFTARDVTDSQEPKYTNMPNRDSIIPIKQCLYNIDNAKDKIVIVEGIFDAWRIGDGAIATLGTKYTMTQVKMILDKKPKSVFVLFDRDAEKEANKLAAVLHPYIPHTEILEIDVKDPAELSDKEVKILRREIGLSL